MTSLKPFLIRAVYEWIVDNGLTPYLLVDADANRGTLPVEYIQDGKILLNIRPQAVEALSLGDNTIEFNARFSGKPMTVEVAVKAVIAIYAKENGKGFYVTEDGKGFIVDQEPGDGNDTPAKSEDNKKPTLKVVK